MNLLHTTARLIALAEQAAVVVGLAFIPFAAVVTVAWFFNLTP